MSYIEIKAIKAIAALHRGVVNTAIRTLDYRQKLAARKLVKQNDYAYQLEVLARNTIYKAQSVRTEANYKFSDSTLAINAAQNTVLNLRDDLNKIT